MFSKYAFVREIFQKLSGSFGRSECKWVKMLLFCQGDSAEKTRLFAGMIMNEFIHTIHVYKVISLAGVVWIDDTFENNFAIEI